MKKLWIDLKAYGLRLVMARGASADSHLLVMAGAGLQQEKDRLEALGFRKDVRFTERNYWIRPMKGMNHAKLLQAFPAAEMVELPVEMIMPAIRKIEVNNRESTSRTAKPSTHGNSSRRAHDDRVGTDGALGQGDPRDSSGNRPSAPEENGGREHVEAVSGQAAGAVVGRSAQAGEGVEAEESASSGRQSATPSELVQPSETVSQRDPARRDREELSDDERSVIASVLSGEAESRTINHAVALVEHIANEWGGDLDTWRESDKSTVGHWKFSSLRLGATEVAIAVSSGGVIQVNRDPFTPHSMGRQLHTNRLAFITSLSLQLRNQISASTYFGITKALFRDGQFESALAHYQQDPSASDVSVAMDDFVEYMAGTAGGSEAALRLTANQRAALFELGATDDEVEQIAIAGGFEKLASATGSSGLAEKLAHARRDKLRTHFEGEGWKREGGQLQRVLNGTQFVLDMQPGKLGLSLVQKVPGDADVVLLSVDDYLDLPVSKLVGLEKALEEAMGSVQQAAVTETAKQPTPLEQLATQLIEVFVREGMAAAQQRHKELIEQHSLTVAESSALTGLFQQGAPEELLEKAKAQLRPDIAGQRAFLHDQGRVAPDYLSEEQRNAWYTGYDAVAQVPDQDVAAGSDETALANGQSSSEPTPDEFVVDPGTDEAKQIARMRSELEDMRRELSAQGQVVDSRLLERIRKYEAALSEVGIELNEPLRPSEIHAYGEDESDGIERDWRGITAEELLDAYSNGNGYTPTQAGNAFKSLAKAEAGESLTEYDRLSLAQFMGWGGVAQAFRTDQKKEYDNRKGQETAKFLGIESGAFNRHVIENRLESYYTPAPLSVAIWKSLMRLGVSPSGKFLEPGCGAGFFFAGAPKEVQAQARLVGVECDEVAVRLAKVIAPDVTILNRRFERAVLDNTFDAVIGNVPFGETKVSDRRYPEASHIHDYFIVRGLDQLRVGGVMAVITSSGTLDKKHPGIRQQIMDRANLVAAFRLPQEVFDEQGASVITDVLFLQRRPDGTTPDFEFTETADLELQVEGQSHSFPVNSYFIDHPENVLGDFHVVSSAFGPKLSVASTRPGSGRQQVFSIAVELSQKMDAALPTGIAQRKEWPKADVTAEETPRSQLETQNDFGGGMLIKGFKGFIGDMTIHDGVLVEIIDVVNEFDDDGIRIGEKFVARPLTLPPKQEVKARSYIQVRDTARELLDAQLRGSDSELVAVQAKAKQAYDAFVNEFGPVNHPANVRVYGDDAGSADACSLEVWDDDKEEVVKLADAFIERVINGDTTPQINTSEDAYYASIDQRGQVDLEYMAEVSGIDQERILGDLLGYKIFIDPDTREYQSADVYLSGNVVLKLAQAKEAVLTDDRYKLNVAALERSQPAPIPFEDITINLGASWIPVDDIRLFTSHLFQLRQPLSERDFVVRYAPQVGLWTVDVSNSFKKDHEPNRKSLWGNEKASFEELLEKLLNNSRPTHTYKDGKNKTVTDEEATVRSREKQEEIANKFFEWIASDPDRAVKYTDLYNTHCNVYVIPRPDGSRLTFPGLAATWQPRAHQKDMVAMALMGRNAMAAHAVGAGKTFEMVAIAMKLKQVGLVTKPCIAVPNHMLGQIAREAKQMYPSARVLMVTKDDLRGLARKRFLAVARNNNWDIIVMTHSMLNQIRPPAEILLAELEDQVRIINDQIDICDNKRQERQLTAKLKTAESKVDALMDQLDDDERRDRYLSIDMLGIDCLNVDEAHLYKNLELNSNMDVLGVTNGGSARAFNLYGISQYFRKHWGKSFGLFSFTGTAVANSMCELYVHNKILRPDLLEESGIFHFDEWANRFGSVVSNLEALPEGGGFRVNERFARFVNLPEMLRLFRTFADVRTKEDLKLPVPQVNTEVVSVEQSDWQKAFMTHLSIRAIQVRKGLVRPDQDNMLAISTAGRKASLDLRLVAADLPEEASLKLGAVAQNARYLYDLSQEHRGTQLVFMDLGTPGKGKPFVAYEALKELMVKAGIPANEIGFAHDAKTDDAKEALFAKVRSGEIRIFMGSTEKMGVGTNVQERLIGMHDVDCPWNPAGIEQRRGRIERQGNLYFDQVYNYRYTTKDSFDLFMWETNKRKGDFINQALSDPTSAGREVSEVMDLGYAEVLAVTTGNPKIREKVEVDDQVKKLERKYKSWLAERASRMHFENSIRKDIARANIELGTWDEARRALPHSTVKVATVTGRVSGLQDGDTSWLYATEIGEAILSRLPMVEAQMMRMSETEASLGVHVGGIEVKLTFERGWAEKYETQLRGFIGGEKLPINVCAPSKNAAVLGKSVRSWFNAAEHIARCQGVIAKAERDLKVMMGAEVQDVWPHEAELAELRDKKSELDMYFTAQDNDTIPAEDPFLAMLAEHRDGLRASREDQMEVFEVGEPGALFESVEREVIAECDEHDSVSPYRGFNQRM